QEIERTAADTDRRLAVQKQPPCRKQRKRIKADLALHRTVDLCHLSFPKCECARQPLAVQAWRGSPRATGRSTAERQEPSEMMEVRSIRPTERRESPCPDRTRC